MGKKESKDDDADILVRFSRGWHKFLLILATPVSLFLIIYGAILVNKKQTDYTKKIKTTITKSSCYITDKNVKICDLTVEYTVNGKKCIKYIRERYAKKMYKKGDTIQMYYNPKNVCNSVLILPDNKTTGTILIGVGIFIFLYAFGDYYLTKKSSSWAIISLF